MARVKSEWAAKVFALVKSGNVAAAVAQIKVAPTVADVTRLQGLLATLAPSPAQKQLDKVVAEELALLAALGCKSLTTRKRLHAAPGATGQVAAFLAGRSSPDFAPEDYELDFAGRATAADLSPLGLQQMGLAPWN